MCRPYAEPLLDFVVELPDGQGGHAINASTASNADSSFAGTSIIGSQAKFSHEKSIELPPVDSDVLIRHQPAPG